MEDIDLEYGGRPFGGVAMLCKNSSGLFFQEIKTPSDRIIVNEVSDSSGRTVQIIICVYMPFFDNKRVNTDNFLETLDIIQFIIYIKEGRKSMLAPIKVCRNFKAALPMGKKLNKMWYHHKDYNQHS